MSTIDVIGDSFSDEEHMFLAQTDIRKDSNKTYLEILRSSFNINNYSWHGIGASQVIERLKNITVKADFLLFILPQIKRIKFKNSMDENVTQDYVNYKNKNLSDDKKNAYDSVYSTTLLDLYDTLCLTYVFNYSKIYKKILIWPATKNKFEGLYHIPSNCHIVEKHLNQISEEEYIKAVSSQKIHGDLRNNHLSGINHKILSEQIKNYFLYDMTPDVDLFERQLFKNNITEFIYE
jgi:hypothetical protein